MEPQVFFDSYRPDKTTARTSLHGQQLSVFYKDIDGCFAVSHDNMPPARRAHAPEKGPSEGHEYYLAPSGHCGHFPQRALRKSAHT
jgi:hypothetical protein